MDCVSKEHHFDRRFAILISRWNDSEMIFGSQNRGVLHRWILLDTASYSTVFQAEILACCDLKGSQAFTEQPDLHLFGQSGSVKVSFCKLCATVGRTYLGALLEDLKDLLLHWISSIWVDDRCDV